MSGMFALNKLWQKSNGAGIKTSLLYTALTGLFVSVIFFAVGGGRVQITPFSLVCAAAVAGLCLGYNLIGFKVFSIGSYSVYMMFLMLGGMLLPFIYGMLFLGDADTIRQAFNVEVTGNTCFLPHILSRKKQVVPMLSVLWG